jgi:hypothetical protein
MFIWRMGSSSLGEIFEKEILVRFGPTEYEDYDEAL